MDSSWRSLQNLDRASLTEARLQAHFATQWLARAARAFVPPVPDDAHTSLGWQDAWDGFVTRRFDNGARLGLRLPDLTLALTGEDGAALAPNFSLIGRTDAEAGEGLKSALRHVGINPVRLDDPPPYAMPDHPIARGAAFGGERLSEGLVELSAWFANAARSLDRARGIIAAMGHEAPPPRCWPHHFDLAMLASFPIPDNEATAYIGAGLSPGDHFYAEPYFYVSIYPQPAAQLPILPALGHWHRDDFTGAIATSEKITASSNPQAETDAFLAAALAAAFNAFAGR